MKYLLIWIGVILVNVFYFSWNLRFIGLKSISKSMDKEMTDFQASKIIGFGTGLIAAIAFILMCKP